MDIRIQVGMVVMALVVSLAMTAACWAYERSLYRPRKPAAKGKAEKVRKVRSRVVHVVRLRWKDQSRGVVRITMHKGLRARFIGLKADELRERGVRKVEFVSPRW